MNIPAKLIKTLPLESGLSLNGPWSKQNIIVETTDDYPKKVCISIWNGRVDISELEIGKEYLYHCNVESNEYKGKWYTILTLWSVDPANKEPTGRPLLSFFSPILKGKESNLEILQKFQSEIRPRFTYTKGIRVGDKISNEDLTVNQKALEYFEFFKNWMNEVAYISIRETMNEFFSDKESFLKFHVVIQKFLINKILEHFYGYKPRDEGSAIDLPVSSIIDNSESSCTLSGEIENDKINHEDPDYINVKEDESGLTNQTNPDNNPTVFSKDVLSKESEPEGKTKDDAVNIKRHGKLKIDPEKLKNFHSPRKIKGKDELNDPEFSL